MGNSANDGASGDAQVDRGSPRRAASQTTSAELSAIMHAGITPDRLAANDRRRSSAQAKTIPAVRMAGSAFGWTTLIAAMTAANLAALLIFSSILQF